MTEWFNYSVVSQCSAFVKVLINVKSKKKGNESLCLFFFCQQMWRFFSDCSGMLIVVSTEYCPADIQSDSHFLSAQFSTVLANKVYSSFSSFVRITFLNAFITFLNIIQIQYSRSAAGCILHLSKFEISYNETKFWSHIWKFSLKQNVFFFKNPYNCAKKHHG